MNFSQMSFDNGILHLANWLGNVIMPTIAAVFIIMAIVQFSKGWVSTAWHENPVPQWIIPLSGRWFVETMDGHRVEMGPGDASLGEDQGSKPDAAGHVGHLSGTLGDAPITLMFVQLDHKVTLNDACRDK